MGRLRPYKTGSTEVLDVKSVRHVTDHYKRDIADNTYATGDAGYVNWVNSLKNEADPFDKARMFVQSLQSREDRVGALAKELTNKITDFYTFKEKLAKTEINSKVDPKLQALNLKEIDELAQKIDAGKEDGRSFDKVLYELNAATNGQFAKKNEFKALYQMSNQIDAALVKYELAAIKQINEDVPQRDKMQDDCLKTIVDYNASALEHTQNISAFQPDAPLNSFEEVTAAYNEKMMEAEKQLSEEKAQLEFKKNELNSLQETEDRKDIGRQKDEAEKEMKLAQQICEDANVERIELIKVVQDSNYVSGKLQNEAKAREQKVTDAYNLFVATRDELTVIQNDLEKTQSDYEKKIDEYEKTLASLKTNSETKKPNFTDQEIQTVKKLKEGLLEINSLQNNPEVSLAGAKSLTTEETYAVIEALRTGSNSDIAAVSEKAMPFYSWMSKYARNCDLVQQQRDGKVSTTLVKGKGFSVPRFCTLGTEAAINLLKETIVTEKNPKPLALSVHLREELMRLSLDMIEQVNGAKKCILDTIQTESEKGKYESDVKKKVKQLQENRDDKSKELVKRGEEYKGLTERVNVVETKTEDEKSKENRQRALDAESKYKKADEIFKAREAAYKKLEQDYLNAQETEKNAINAANEDIKAREAKIAELAASKEELKNKYELLAKQNANVAVKKNACVRDMTTLQEQKANVCQKDARRDTVAKKIALLASNVDFDNPETAPGKFDHKNGKRYTELRKQLLALHKGIEEATLTKPEICKGLSDLKEAAQAYLDTRKKDVGFKLFGGTLFRFNRMNYAADIVNSCTKMGELLSQELKMTEASAEMVLDRTREDLMLSDPTVENIGLMKAVMEQHAKADKENELAHSENAPVNENTESLEQSEENSVLNESTYTQPEDFVQTI